MGRRSFGAKTAILVVMMLSACATNAARIQATDASVGQPIPKAEVVIEPNAPTPADSPQFLAAANAVGPELSRRGFRLAAAPNSTSELVAVVDYTKVDRPRSWLARTFGGAPNASADKVVDRKRGYFETVTLKVDLKRRSDQSIIWRGKASIDTRVDSPTPAGEAPFAAELSAAAFKHLVTSGQ